METVQATPPSTMRQETAASTWIFAALIILPVVICLFRGVVDDPDVWWHLKAGEWILSEGAFPSSDSFSSWGAGGPWTAYSWLPELMLVGLTRSFGLAGLIVYTAAVSAGIVAALLAMIRRLTPNPTLAVGLTLAGILGLILLETPRPWLFSILFFIIELDLLLTAGRSGNRKLLLWLIPLFALWANMHIQFVLGLVVLAAAVAESLLVRRVPRKLVDEDACRIDAPWMLLVFGLSAAATLLNPYHYHLYEVALQLVGQSKLWNVIQELRAMPFRCVADWTVLAVAMAAAFALGWRRQTRPLLVMLLAMAVYFGFRSRRDAWIVLVVGLAVVAHASPKDAVRLALPRGFPWAVGAAVAAVLLAVGLFASESKLEEKLARSFPVEATEFIHARRCDGPMFNPFSWGGYLIYHLPELPVSIDGRTMVHGQDRVLRHAETLKAKPGWRDDPELTAANLVLLPRDSTLSTLLRVDGRFRLIHEDDVAAVFCSTRNDLAQDNPR